MLFGKKGIFSFLSGGTVTINETTHVVKNTMVLNNNKITIDGVDVTEDYEKVTIVINGNVEKIDIAACKELNVTGTVGEIKTSSGNITCGEVKGNVESSQGNITAGNVGHDVTTSQGRIECGAVTGKVKSDMGNITVNGDVAGAVKTDMGNINIKKSK